jgi:hypothetical protein
MTPWTKERRMQEVIKWMYDENPDIWYLPAAVTKANRVGQTINLSEAEAAAVFESLEERQFINPVLVNTTATANGTEVKVTMSAWQLALPEKSGEIDTFIKAEGFIAMTVKPVVKEYLQGDDKWWAYGIFAAAAVVGGFFASLGELIFGLVKDCVVAIGRCMLG